MAHLIAWLLRVHCSLLQDFRYFVVCPGRVLHKISHFDCARMGDQGLRADCRRHSPFVIRFQVLVQVLHYSFRHEIVQLVLYLLPSIVEEDGVLPALADVALVRRGDLPPHHIRLVKHI